MEPKETLPAPRSDGWVQLGLLLLALPLSLCVSHILQQQLWPTLHEFEHAATDDPAGAEVQAIALMMAILLAYEAVLLMPAVAWRRGSAWARPTVQLTRRGKGLLFLDGLAVGIPAALVFAVFMWWTGVIPGDSRYEGYVAQPSPYFLSMTLPVRGFMAALCEEMYFRGALYALSRRLMPHAWAWIANVVLFSASHAYAYDNPAHMTAIVVGGALFCHLYRRSRSIIPGATCHSIMNITSTLLTQAI